MTPVRVGVIVPQGLSHAAPSELRGALRRIEDAGLDHVGVADHVSFYTGWGQDALMEAGMLAMLTELPVHLGVYLLALRHPVTAKPLTGSARDRGRRRPRASPIRAMRRSRPGGAQ